MAAKTAPKTTKASVAKTPALDLSRIGETAGSVWRVLFENGPLTVAKLVKAVGEPRDLVMQAIGWLAREGKICVKEEGRNCLLCLQGSEI
ncbi:MAG: winged helix-turn-helix domain-containing protein [Thermoguttaceae bacterium]